jgi:hypothetical protein
MSEYEDRYPDAYGRQEETDPKPRRRGFLGFGLLHHMRDREPPLADTQRDKPLAVDIQEAGPAPAPRRPRQQRRVERVRRPVVERNAQEICDDIAQQLAASPSIDASGISITVNGAEVTLGGTVNSLIEISMAQALVSNVPGVGRVQVQLRVQPAPRPYETAGGSARKAEK